MAQIIKIRRGTTAGLTAFGPLKEAEMGFCTDTKEVFIGDGNINTFVGKAMCGTFNNRPIAKVEGRFYFVTTGTNSGYLYMDDGIAWHQVNVLSLSDLSGNLDNIKDGITYGRVKNEDLSIGHVNKISDGSNTLTVGSIKGHMDDSSKHRVINDGSSSATDLWSSQKIRNEIELAKHNIEYQASVKNRVTATPPTQKLVADRYIIATAAINEWSGKLNNIAEWNGASWDYYAPSIGWTCYVDDEQKQYSWNGIAWVRVGGALQTIEAGKGLTGGGQADNVILNIGSGAGITVSDDAISVKAYQGIIVNANGVAANIDGNSIQYDASNGNRLKIVNIDGGTF